MRCKPILIKCFVDSKSLVETLNSTKNVDDRRLRIDIAVLRNMVENKEISSVYWIPTCKQLTDCLTKKGASSEHLLAVFSGR